MTDLHLLEPGAAHERERAHLLAQRRRAGVHVAWKLILEPLTPAERAGFDPTSLTIEQRAQVLSLCDELGLLEDPPVAAVGPLPRPDATLRG